MSRTTLVEASAGTGKTWRITQTVVGLLVDHGLSIDRILVVTFTEAATAELRGRVRRRIGEVRAGVRAAQRDPKASFPKDADLAALIDKHRARLGAVEACLTAALEQFDAAPISTIHGFCQRMLGRFGLEAGVPLDRPPGDHLFGTAQEVALDHWSRELHDVPPEIYRAVATQFGVHSRWTTRNALTGVAVKAAEDPRIVVVPDPDGRPLGSLSLKDDDVGLHLALSLAYRAPAEVHARLDRAGVFTFHDLLIRLRDALARPGTGERLAQAIRDTYQAALIDEFQDTDPVQWQIFGRLFHGHRPLWLIGDPKQAIYHFRGADLDTYLEAAQTEGVSSGDPLRTNHRSDPGLVQAVNHLFGRVPDAFLQARIPFERVDAQAKSPRLVGDGLAPLQVRWVGAREGGNRAAREVADAELAALCADDVAVTLNAGPQVGEGPEARPVRPADCAVLVRTNEQGALVRDALRAAGIPAIFRKEDNVLCAPMAQSLRKVLAAMHDPQDDTLRASALFTPIVGLSVADIAGLAVDDEALALHVGRFRGWGRLWKAKGALTAVWQALSELQTLERLLRGPMGARQVADLLHLVELIHLREQRGASPEALIHWLADQGPDAGDEVTSRLEADSDAVTVITIHKAKGLEWPLVWCPYLNGTSFLSKGDTLALPVGRPGGQRLLDLRPADDPDKEQNLEAAHQEAFAEVLRLTYVALTRARHRCVVFWGAFPKAARSGLGWLFHADRTRKTPAARIQALVGHLKDATPDELFAEMRAIADGSKGTIGVVEVDAPTGTTWSGSVVPRPLVGRALSRTQPLDLLWRRASFSALTRDSWAEHVARTEDRAVDPVDDEPIGPTTDAETVPLAEIPAFGTALGQAMHDALEWVDFQQPETLDAHVVRAFQEHGVPVAHAPAVAASLEDVLRTPLIAEDPSFTLSIVSRADRRSELAFHLPVSGGFQRAEHLWVCGAVADALAAWPDPAIPDGYAASVRRLRWTPLRGFLTGLIDLVVRRQGQIYVSDYKSNRVDATFASFTPDRLAEEMASHHYILQGLLYGVAVHRWMRVRDPSYRYDRHFGGVLYLFLRGMTPRTGAGRGIWRWRPAEGLIDQVDRSLRGDT